MTREEAPNRDIVNDVVTMVLRSLQGKRVTKENIKRELYNIIHSEQALLQSLRDDPELGERHKKELGPARSEGHKQYVQAIIDTCKKDLTVNEVREDTLQEVWARLCRLHNAPESSTALKLMKVPMPSGSQKVH